MIPLCEEQAESCPVHGSVHIVVDMVIRWLKK